MDMTVYKIVNPGITAKDIENYRNLSDDEEFIESLIPELKEKKTRDFLFNIYFYGKGEELVKDRVFKAGEGDRVTNEMIREAINNAQIDCELDAMFYYLSIVLVIKAKKDIYTQLGQDTPLLSVANETYATYLSQKRAAIEKNNPKRYLLTILKNERLRIMSQDGTPLGALYKAGSKNREKFKAAMRAAQSDDVHEANQIFNEITTDNFSSNFALQQVYNQARSTVSLDAQYNTKNNDTVTVAEAIADTRDCGFDEVEDRIMKSELLNLLPCPLMRLIIEETYLSDNGNTLIKKAEKDRARKQLKEQYGIESDLYDETLRHAEDILSYKLDPYCEKDLNRRRVKKPVDPIQYETRKKIFSVSAAAC